jgi:hypothetical protein
LQIAAVHESVLADIVAKLGNDHSARNNRIETGIILNQRCVLRSDFELMLRAQRPKIVLQQYRHEPAAPMYTTKAG